MQMRDFTACGGITAVFFAAQKHLKSSVAPRSHVQELGFGNVTLSLSLRIVLGGFFVSFLWGTIWALARALVEKRGHSCASCEHPALAQA